MDVERSRGHHRPLAGGDRAAFGGGAFGRGLLPSPGAGAGAAPGAQQPGQAEAAGDGVAGTVCALASTQGALHGPRSRVEKRRPILAAQELYEAAMRKSGLDLDNVVGKVVEQAARRAHVPIVPAAVKLVIEDPKSVLKEFNASALADTECFTRTMSRIDQQGVG